MKKLFQKFSDFIIDLFNFSWIAVLSLLIRVVLTVLLICSILWLISITPLWHNFQQSFIASNDLGRSNNIFDRLIPFWDFLQGIGTILALISLTIAATEYVESKKRERIKFKAEMDPLVVPEPIQNFYLQDSPYKINFTTINIINTGEVIAWDNLTIQEQQIYKENKIKPEKLLRTSWFETIYDILPANDKRVKYHALFFISNLRKGIANNVEIEICNGTVRQHQRIYDFNSDKIVYEGPHYDLIEGNPIIIFKDEKYKNAVCFDENFCIRITYTSNYTDYRYIEVYEAEVSKKEFYVLQVNNSIETDKDSQNKTVGYDKNVIHAEANKTAMLSYIRMFNKITETDLEKKGIYYSRDVKRL